MIHHDRDEHETPVTVSRRQLLSGALVAGGAGLGLGDILRLRADAAEGVISRDTAVIQIWRGGGPSQFETFDPKPDAPSEFRGPYDAISTKLPGVFVCEKLSKIAAVLDQAVLIRSVTHATNGHFVGAHWCVTGYEGTNNRASHPSNGSLASRLCGSRRAGLPAYVLLSEEQTRNPEIATVMGPGYLGIAHAPFTVLQSSFVKEFQPMPLDAATSSLKLADHQTLDRLGDRQALLRHLDRLPRRLDATRMMEGMDHFQQAALEMVTTAGARAAFDLARESTAVRERYGAHRWGQMALLARRLVEAGVTFVTLNMAPDSLCWDWHRNIVNDRRPADGSDGPSRGMDVSGPPFDQALAALITDLYERGLHRKVLLVVWGEFGRTPRVNVTGGRDHWGSLMSILVAGGGARMGQVIGSSDDKGEVPANRPVSPTDVLATIYRHLGIDAARQMINASGRPVPLLPDGRVIEELV